MACCKLKAAFDQQDTNRRFLFFLFVLFVYYVMVAKYLTASTLVLPSELNTWTIGVILTALYVTR
jgi:hypothetical protein